MAADDHGDRRVRRAVKNIAADRIALLIDAAPDRPHRVVLQQIDSQVVERWIALDAVPALDGSPGAHARLVHRAAFEDEHAVWRQVVSQLSQQTQLVALVVNGREEEDAVELLVGDVPPARLDEFGVWTALPCALDKVVLEIDADDAARALPQRLHAEEAFVAAEVEHRLVLERRLGRIGARQVTEPKCLELLLRPGIALAVEILVRALCRRTLRRIGLPLQNLQRVPATE